MGSVFLKKVMEFINEKRIDIFQAVFYKLFEKYGGDLDRFIDEWFVEYSYKTLNAYFNEELFKEDFEVFYRKKANIIRAYVKAYWSYCLNPYKRPHSIEIAMSFFDLKDLDEKELKRKYRDIVKIYHPDIYSDKRSANEKLKEVNHYYQILKAYIAKFRKEGISCYG
ncbi:MAG: DnaJ domain-containing protein [Aquificota bacterium]